jgi:hypothetical protein
MRGPLVGNSSPNKEAIRKFESGLLLATRHLTKKRSELSHGVDLTQPRNMIG